MVRQLGQASYVTFVKGLNTEAGPLTFPENCTIEDINCVLTLKGSHKRRYGIKQELEGKPLNIGSNILSYNDFKEFAFNTYTWKAPGNVGAKSFLVMQVNDKLFFYDISQNLPLSLTGFSTSLDLSSVIVDKDLFKKTGCSFASGKGFLFIAGKGLEPCYVEYKPDTSSLEIKKLLLRIRDTTGVDDGLDNNTQPTTLSDEHLYNLINQGWLYGGTSSVIGFDVKAVVDDFYVFEKDGTGYVYLALFIDGTQVWSGNVDDFKYGYFNQLSPEKRAHLTVEYSRHPDHYELATCTFTVDDGYQEEYINKPVYIVTTRKNGEQYFSKTKPFLYYDAAQQSDSPYVTYFNSKQKYPSNSQQWFVGRQVQQLINVNEVANFDFGNKRAPRGRCIIDPFTEDRTGVVNNLLPEKEDKTRIIDTAFMGGRVFYLRQNQLLYSQVIEDIKQASMCYTEGDPTSEDGFDVVDTDGGAITITDMGDAIALFELQNGLAVFAKNGIWLVTGLSSDEGFKATGYSVRKLSNLECVSKNSIVNVQGAPLFWATSGIYVIAQRDYTGYDVQSLSDTTIQSKYVEIPKHNLQNVTGVYNAGAQRVAWFYDVSEQFSDNEKERKTKGLIYDVRLKAFYELEMDNSEEHPFICGAFNTPYLSFVSLEEEVYDNNDDVVMDNNGDIVYTKVAIKNTDLTDVKYLAFEKFQGVSKRISINNNIYTRDPSLDKVGTPFNLAWSDGASTVYTVYDEPTECFTQRPSELFPPELNVYYRYPQEDKEVSGEIYKAYHTYTAVSTPETTPDTLYYKTSMGDLVVGGGLYKYVNGNMQIAARVSSIPSETLLEYEDSSGNYGGFIDGYYEAFAGNIVKLTSCNFDDITFKDWGSADYTSTFTTGVNTTGDSFIKKDLVYLTTQLSRTEAVNTQGNIYNDSSCMLQMKWDFEDNSYSHKWTTPVQIYRSRRLFAPGLDTPGFDDISIRMPVITTKHKIRGVGRALQIKFTSEPGKNFEVLGWNIVVGARS